MKTQIKNGILQFQLQWVCYLLVRTGKKIIRLKSQGGIKPTNKLLKLQQNLSALNCKIGLIEASFVD
ncbi:MAG: hypothetical protein NC081_00830 [Roseburia sp.]|nr:hypothetical protein [Roseburia sp.]